jgi:hypothetical protein
VTDPPGGDRADVNGHAADFAPVLAGHTSLGEMADELNARGVLPRRGGRWHKSTVMNLLDRLGLRQAGPQDRPFLLHYGGPT